MMGWARFLRSFSLLTDGREHIWPMSDQVFTKKSIKNSIELKSCCYHLQLGEVAKCLLFEILKIGLLNSKTLLPLRSEYIS